MVKISKLVVYGALAAISARYVDYQALFTWGVWSATILLGSNDRCYLRNPFLMSLFSSLEKRDLRRDEEIPATPPVIIEAKDYSFRALELLSQHWTQPVIVRGLFADAPALSKWTSPDYLAQTFLNSSVSVIHNGTIVKHYEMVCAEEEQGEATFSEYKPFVETLRRIASEGSTETIVYPPASRSKRIRDKEVEERWNEMVKNDVNLKTVGGGIFDDGARSTVLTQMFLGGSAAPSKTEAVPAIGTGWHGDICNNFVVQVSGVKQWVMVDPKYSHLMRPTMRGGKTAIVGGHLSIEQDTLPYFPHHEFLLHPGDMLYNPEWYWHSIRNLPGGPYAFGLISRQCHIQRNFKQASAFTSMVVANHVWAAIFDVEARMRLYSAITGASLMKPEKGVNVDAQNEVRGGYT